MPRSGVSPVGVALGAVIVFALWTWFMHPWEATPPDIDANVAHHWEAWSKDHPRMTPFMVFVTDLGGVAAMTLLAIMGSIWQTAINHRTLAFAWLAIVISDDAARAEE